MIKLVIFSKDRASQLDLLLRSIHTNAKNYFDISIITKASNFFFTESYKRLQYKSGKEDYGYPNFKIRYESQYGFNFRETLLDEISEEKNSHQLTCFMTDDCVFFNPIYRHFTLDQIYDLLNYDDSCCVSLRVGLNTTIQTYYLNDKLPSLEYVDCGGFIKWNHYPYPQHSTYGYIFSVDGHIFRSDLIRDFYETTWWENPNSLEASLSNRVKELPPNVFAPKKQCLVACPLNDVAGWGNKHGLYHSYTVEELNQKYLSGNIIGLYPVINYLTRNVNCTHLETPLEFENESKNTTD